MKLLHALADPITGPTSCLRIHPARNEARGPFKALLHGVQQWVHPGAPSTATGPQALDIQDLQGARLLAVEDVLTPIEVMLPTGTYHVTTRCGPTRRSYTVALEHGATTDLYLQA